MLSLSRCRVSKLRSGEDCYTCRLGLPPVFLSDYGLKWNFPGKLDLGGILLRSTSSLYTAGKSPHCDHCMGSLCPLHQLSDLNKGEEQHPQQKGLDCRVVSTL